MAWKSRKTLIICGVFLFGLIVGGGVSFFVSSYFLSRFFQMGSNISKTVTIKQDVQLLEYLQENRTDKAKELVEMLLDGEVIYYIRGIPGSEDDRKAVTTALKKARDYRSQHPRSTQYPEIDKTVAKVLMETEKTK
jgi:hypothetical protein